MPDVCVVECGRRLLELDAAAARALNAHVRRSRQGQRLAGWAAGGLASAEVLLMLTLAAGGQRRSALRMLLAVASVFGVSELIGWRWRRDRPFARMGDVQELIGHGSGRSFPSRHVASGLAMAAVGQAAHPRLGQLMAALAWLLGMSRVAAGLHYPSDVLAGAVLGAVIGRFWRA